MGLDLRFQSRGYWFCRIATFAALMMFACLKVPMTTWACDLNSSAHALKAAIRGIFRAEVELNRNLFDELQIGIYLPRFESFSSDDWTSWLEYNEELAESAAKIRIIANKWPQGLVVTGYVQSFGPGQITPRTIINVCRRRAAEAYCKQSIGKQVIGLFDELGAYDAAAVILLDAKIEMKQKWSGSPTIGAIATAYNVGTDYYLKKFHENEKNKFGAYVESLVCSKAIEPITD